MPRMLIYGEDGLTLKYTKERLGEILQQLGDDSNPADCTVFFRPSLGRGQWYGEFDAIIISQEKAYLVEAKWDSGRDLTGKRKQRPIKLDDNQVRRHRILKWFSENWNGEEGQVWDRFAEKNRPNFETEFEFMKDGKKEKKSIPPSDSILGQNLQTIFSVIGKKKMEDVLLIFYRDKQPEVAQEGFTAVAVQYEPTLDNFSELE